MAVSDNGGQYASGGVQNDLTYGDDGNGGGLLQLMNDLDVLIHGGKGEGDGRPPTLGRTSPGFNLPVAIRNTICSKSCSRMVTSLSLIM